ncbi:MAG: hypothetical protein V1676_03540 [Candidatus Diapherotrites archaeon]
MEKSEIIKAIEGRVMAAESKNYSIWTVGITNNPGRRKNEHESEKNVRHWNDWKADSENEARDIEKYFLAKGMKGEAGGGENPTYVYIF